jgi:hypothetical protein
MLSVGTLYLPGAEFGKPDKFGFTEPLAGSVELLVMQPSRQWPDR